MATVKEIIFDIKTKTNAGVIEAQKLAKAIDDVEKELAQATKGTLAYYEAERKLLNLQKQTNVQFDQTEKSVNKLSNTFSKAQNNILKLGAITGIGFAFGDAVRTIQNFDQSLADLSAITGATGGDLEFYKEQARELGRTTTVSASEAVEAFKLLGSAKPELLANSAALVDLTEKAVILSEASGLTLPEAATNLGNALNALELPASEAGRVIDVLAVSAQKGKKEIPFVTEALSKFGGIAKQAGVSIEDSAAAVQFLGSAIPDAATAGTNFRNILTILQVQAAKQGRAFKGLGGELDLLAPKLNDVVFLEKTFGRENLLAAQTLISNKDALAEFSAGLNESGAAQKQAETRTSTLSGAFTRLKNNYEDFLLNASNSTGTFAKVINFLADNLSGILSTIVTLGVAYATYKTASAAASAAQFLFAKSVIGANGELVKQGGLFPQLIAKYRAAAGEATTASGKISGAFRGLGAIIKSIPIGTLVTGLLALGKVIFDAISGTKQLTFAQKTLKDAEDSLNKSIAEESAGMNVLFDALKKTNPGTKEREDLIKKLQDQYPDYVKNLKLENATLQEIEQAQANANTQLKINIGLKIKQQKLEEIYSARIQRQLDLTKKLGDEVGLNEKLAGEFLARASKAQAGNKNNLTAAQRNNQGISDAEYFESIFGPIVNDKKFAAFSKKTKDKLLAVARQRTDAPVKLVDFLEGIDQLKDEDEAIKELDKFFDNIENEANKKGPIKITATGSVTTTLTDEEKGKIKKLAQDRFNLEQQLKAELQREVRTGQDSSIKDSEQTEIEKLKAQKILQDARIEEDLNAQIAAAKKEGLLTDATKKLFEDIRAQRLLNNEKEVQAQITKIQKDEEKKRLELQNQIGQNEIDINIANINIDKKELENVKADLEKKLAEATSPAARAAIQEDLKRIKALIISDIEEIKEEQLKKIDLQEQFDLSNAKSDEERKSIQQKAQLERLKLEADTIEQEDALKDEQLERDKKRKQDLLDATKNLFDETLKFADALLNAQIARIDMLIDAQQKRVDKAAEIAENGNAELLELEQKRLDDLEKKRQKAVNAQKALALIEIAFNTAVAVAKAASQTGVGAPVAIITTIAAIIAGIAAATQIASNAGGSFAEGGWTGKGSGKRDRTGFRIAGVVHEDEFVMPKHIVNKGQNKGIFQKILRGRMDIGRELATQKELQYLMLTGGMSDKKADEMINAVKNIQGTDVKWSDGFMETTIKKQYYKQRIKKRIS